MKAVWRHGLQRLRTGGTRYAANSLICHLLNGVSGVMIMRWLEPVALGWWNVSQMLRIPLDVLRAGILSGMNREYPLLMGSNEKEKARKVLETGLAHTLATVVVSQMMLGAVLFYVGRDQHLLFCGLLTNGLVWSVGYYSQYVRSSLRTSHNFRLISQIDLGIAAVDSVAVLLVWRFGYYGLIGRALLSSVLFAGSFYHFRPAKVRPRWNGAALARMYRFGRHTYLTGYMLLVGSYSERLVLLTLNDGVRLLGLYTPAIACASIMQIIPGSIQNYYYPQIMEAYGREHDDVKLLAMILTQIKRATLMMLGVSAASTVGIWLLIKFVLPGYESSRLAATLVCIAGPFYPLRMCASYYAALHHWREYYAFTTLQTILPFLIMWSLLPLLPPLIAVAVGYVISVAASGVVLLWFTLNHASRTKTGHRNGA